jgi:hypothetical protein
MSIGDLREEEEYAKIAERTQRTQRGERWPRSRATDQPSSLLLSALSA